MNRVGQRIEIVRNARLARAMSMAGILLATIAGGCDDKGKSATEVDLSGARAPAPTPTTPIPAPAPAAAVEKPKAAAGGAEFVDSDFGFRATPQAGWRVAPSEGYTVPGKIVKAWTSDGTNSIVAFLQDAGQPVPAKAILDSSAAAMKQAGHQVSLEEVTKMAGRDAMSLKLSGAGSGAALGNGSIQTYQHWIAIPKQNRVLVLLLTAPDSTKAAAAKDFEAMAQSVKVD